MITILKQNDPDIFCPTFSSEKKKQQLYNIEIKVLFKNQNFVII